MHTILAHMLKAISGPLRVRSSGCTLVRDTGPWPIFKGLVWLMVARETGSHGTKQKSAHKELPVTALLEAGVATWPHGTQWISPRSVPQIKECCAITTCNCPCPEKPCQLFGFIPIPSFFKTQHPRRELFLLFTPCLP